MREIVLQPGESVTLEGVTVRCVNRSGLEPQRKSAPKPSHLTWLTIDPAFGVPRLIADQLR